MTKDKIKDILDIIYTLQDQLLSLPNDKLLCYGLKNIESFEFLRK